ncbi:DUF853 family protein [Candidatus Woesearchaeota archaeon]|nr:DUF853 family protein [Candidatus Woesearchaeota archaeon]
MNLNTALKDKKRAATAAALTITALILIYAAANTYNKGITGSAVTQTKAGTISIVEVVQEFRSQNWQGYYGLQLMLPGYTEQQTDDAVPGEVREKHFVFNCLQPGKTHELYATPTDPTLLDWSTARAGTTTMVDSYMNVSANSSESATATFTDNYTFEIGSTNITMPATFTKQYNNASSRIFPLGILNVSGSVVMVTKKNSITVKSYKNSTVNYQIMAPLPNITTTYYFLSDPYDTCPAGLGIGTTGDGTVAGRAFDQDTGLPIDNATITVGGSTNYTNATGHYNFTTAIGTYSLVASKQNYFTYFTQVNISLAETTLLDFNMSKLNPTIPANGTISGYATDNTTGQPISTASISIAGTIAQTNNTGYYTINTTPGTHNIVATKTDYENFIGNATITPNAITSLNITLTRIHGTISGYVTDADYGIYINNATIFIGGKTAQTNNSGYYTVNATGGQHTLLANRTGYEAYITIATVTRGNTTTHNISLKLLTGYVAGYVQDSSTGQLLANATVSIAGNAYTTDTTGAYNLSAPKGEHNIMAVKSSYMPHAANITISSGLTTQHNISMDRFSGEAQNGTITGQVFENVTNTTISGATISVNGANTTSNGNGTYTINATAGTHNIIAVKDGYEPTTLTAHVTDGQTTYKNISLNRITLKRGPGNITIISNITAGTNITEMSVTQLNFSNASINFTATLTFITNVNITDAKVTALVMTSIDANTPDIPIITKYYDFQSSTINNTNIMNLSYNITYAQKDLPNFFNKSYLSAYHYNTTTTNWEKLNTTANPNNNSVHFTPNHMSLYVIGLSTGTATGNISDIQTGKRIQDVLVSSGGITNLTDSAGTYILNKVSAGSNTIAAIKSGYTAYLSTVNIQPDQTTPHNLSIAVPAPALENGTINGYIKDNSGVAVQGATVSVAGRMMTTDTKGYYTENISQGTHVIVATKTGYENFIGNVTINASNTTQKNITLNPFIPSTVVQIITGGGQGESTGVGKKAVTLPTNIRIPPKIVDYEFSLEKITAKLKKGTYTTIPMNLKNYKQTKIETSFKTEGKAEPLVKLSSDKLTISPSSEGKIDITILANTDPGVYTGKLTITGDIKKEIPIEILVYSEDKLPVESLKVKINLPDSNIRIGSKLHYRVELQNQLQEEGFSVKLTYTATNKKNYTQELGTDEIEIRTAMILVKATELPKDIQPGDYALIVKAEYLGTTSTHTAYFKMSQPIYKYSILGVPLWIVLITTGLLATGTFTTLVYKKRKAEKKRYKASVNPKNLPKEGPRGMHAGIIVDTSLKAIMDMDQLPLHTLISGASGSGKTITAQVMAEEALMKGVSIVVIDPTAQWTGFLRPCTDKKMLANYKKFSMKPSSARPFNGNIKAISDETEEIEYKKLMKPEEINIFVTKGLETKQLETLIASMIDRIFSENFPEAREIKYLIIIDGIHNLLPKFGGTGNVFVKIERAVREFRKWGIGLVIISQTMNDFSDEIKANINTQIMHRVRDEKDMAVIKEEYGEEILQSMIKADMSVAMYENAAYNQGKPYFIQLRPVMHDQNRITDTELINYTKYNEIIEDMETQVSQLEALNIDVFDMKLGIKMITDKIKTGNFSMADIYLEDLRNSTANQFKKLGKTPEKKAKRKKQAQEEQNSSEAQLQTLIAQTNTLLQELKTKEAEAKYTEIQKQYSSLSPEDKKKATPQCIELRNRIIQAKNGTR